MSVQVDERDRENVARLKAEVDRIAEVYDEAIAHCTRHKIAPRNSIWLRGCASSLREAVYAHAGAACVATDGELAEYASGVMRIVDAMIAWRAAQLRANAGAGKPEVLSRTVAYLQRRLAVAVIHMRDVHARVNVREYGLSL